MYFVDQKRIEEILTYMDSLLTTFDKNVFESVVEKLALERMLHILIESTLDVGNQMIDGFIMRDPGSYEDIIDILIDEKVLPKEEETVYKQLVGFRKQLVSNYMAVDHDALEKSLRENLTTLQTFSTNIRVYLKNELGVANAFIPEE